MITTKRAQVRALLEERIATQLGPGDALDSERALVAELGVSRVTVRHAIDDLVAAGLLERTQGKGTYVTGPRINSRIHLTSFSREMRSRGLSPATRVIEAREILAPIEVAERMGLGWRDRVTELERLRLADGTPIAYEVGYYPVRLMPGLANRDLSSVYDILTSHYGINLARGEQVVSAESADAHQAHILDVPRRAPLLVQQRLTYAADGAAVELATSWYRGDRYRIHSVITPTGIGAERRGATQP